MAVGWDGIGANVKNCVQIYGANVKSVQYERKIYQAMLDWKEKLAPHYALFLKGARRVGKTTLAEKLGREAYKRFILVRFDQEGDDIRDLFINSLRDLDHFYAALQLLYRTYLHERTAHQVA